MLLQYPIHFPPEVGKQLIGCFKNVPPPRVGRASVPMIRWPGMANLMCIVEAKNALAGTIMQRQGIAHSVRGARSAAAMADDEFDPEAQFVIHDHGDAVEHQQVFPIGVHNTNISPN